MAVTESPILLHVPQRDELWFRKELMAQPETMAYNAGYDLAFAGYHPETGCIDFPEEKWAEWYAYFVGQQPRRFYAYVVRRSDGRFVGEVNLHDDAGQGRFEMGIVLEAAVRGQGLSRPALEALLEAAFTQCGAKVVHNDFERTRTAALALHKSVGFRVTGEHDGIVDLEMAAEEWKKR